MKYLGSPGITALFALLPFWLIANTIPVTTTADAGAGSLRQAVMDAAPGDTVVFQALSACDTVKLDSQIVIDKNLVIIGNGDDSTKIDGQGQNRIFLISSGDSVIIHALAIQNGSSSSDGGGVFNEGTLTISHSTFSRNTAAELGGGVYNEFGSALVISHSTFFENTAIIDGGGVLNFSSTLTISHSTFSGNSGLSGGGVYDLGGTLTILQSTFSGNTAGRAGGGVFDFSGPLAISHSTFSGNTAIEEGGGVYKFSGSFHTGHSIYANESTIAGHVGVSSNGYNLFQEVPADGTTLPTDKIDMDPLLDTLANNGGPTKTHALLCGSPAIDCGDPGSLGTDQRGEPTVRRMDIGAFELQNDDSFVNTKNTVTILADDGAGTLRQLIRNACPGDTIFFNAMTACDTVKLDSQITIEKNLVIIGNGDDSTKIEGQGLDRIFEITIDNSVEIHALSIQNGSAAGDGGGVINTGTLFISQSTFSGNSAINGGGIYNDGTLFISRSTFSGNTAITGGGVLNNGTLSISRSTFFTNTANAGGGAFSFIGTLTISQSTFSGNTSSSGGGVFNYNNSTLSISRSTFSGNIASFGGGGVLNSSTFNTDNSIYAYGSTIDGTVTSNGYNLFEHAPAGGTTSTDKLDMDPLLDTLADNGGPTKTHALLCGSPAIDGGDPDSTGTDQRGEPTVRRIDIGAFELQNDDPFVNTKDTVTSLADDGAGTLRQLIRNACTGDTICFNAITAFDTVKLDSQIIIDKDLVIIGNGDDSTKIDGQSQDRIFFIPGGVKVEIHAMTIQNGTSNSNGGGVYNDGTLTISHSNFSGNWAYNFPGNGGGVANYGTLTVSHSIFSDNTGRLGAGVFNKSDTLDISNSTFSGNYADYGGGVGNFGTLTISHSAFSDNTARFEGGGVYDYEGSLAISQSTFSGNTVTFLNGGGVTSYRGILVISQSTFYDNTAASSGGGVYKTSGTFSISQSTFSENTAASSGGGVYHDSDPLSISNSTFSKNTAISGGGVSKNSGSLTISQSTFSGNTADFGGGCLNAGTLTISQSTFSGNTANFGGGCYNSNTISISQSTFSGNTGTTRGGGIWINAGAHTISHSTFSGNISNSGGGVFKASGSLTISQSTFSGNTAAARGGGVRNNTGPLAIANSTFFENISGSDGGGVFKATGILSISQSTFFENSAASSGGGVRNSSGTLAVSQSTFSGNTAQFGGGIWMNVGIHTISQSTFSGNSGLYGGGVENGGILSISQSTFFENTGTYGGGTDNTGSLTIARSTFSGNTASAIGGGVLNNGTLAISQSTFSGNTAAGGGGVYYFSGNFNTDHSIYADGSTIVGGGSVSSDGYNLFQDVPLWTTDATDIIGLDPLLNTLADNGGPTKTHALLCGSPVIDMAHPDSTGVDQRGFPMFGGLLDIGAFELQDNCLPYCEASGNNQYGWISQVIALNGSMSNSSGADDGGYGNYRELTICNPDADRYHFYLDSDGPLSSSPAYWRAWIDWDNSNSFDPWEQVIQKNTTGGFYATVFIPSWIPDGQYIMRIAMNQFSGYPDACSDLSYGEYEDYSVCKGQQQAPPPPAAQAPNLSIFTGSDPSIRLYPNPVSDHLYIELDAAQDGTQGLRVISPLGKTVYSGEWTAAQSDNSLQLDVRQWPAGLYYLEVSSGERQWMLPFVRTD